MVGNYALKFVWGDGHGEGLYVWEHLRGLCGCHECSTRREAAIDAAGLSGVANLAPGVPTVIPQKVPTAPPIEHAGVDAAGASRDTAGARAGTKHGPEDTEGKAHSHGR